MNRLASETSPYLRQHADNPVDWYPWGNEAFTRAKDEDKPILLSVGYSACHWCHVMAHESFEDDEVAAVMNDRFVNVKVDREERPDVDSIYMDAVQALTGRGGWPMTVFLTPDGNPFFGGTYFPKDDRQGMPGFIRVMDAVEDVWRNRRDDVFDQAAQLTTAMAGSNLRDQLQSGAGTGDLSPAVLDQAEDALGASFDAVLGGFGSAPKFPPSMAIDFLLRRYVRNAAPETLTMVTTTLDAMAAGGIYDHVGGGFARYSTDAHWLVPHFEKMLYDEALLVGAYLRGYLVTGEPRYRRVVEETIEYVLRDLRHPDGGFFSAEDADSEGVEGKFYLWSLEELTEVCGNAAPEVIRAFGVTAGGNFRDPHTGYSGNILHLVDRTEAPSETITDALRRLFARRETRVRPGLDDKVLLGWNALFLRSLAEAAAAFDRADWMDAARANARVLRRALRRVDGRLLRSWHEQGGGRHLAVAEDYAALLEAYLTLAEVDDVVWLEDARGCAGELFRLFHDEETGGFFTTGNDAEALIVRPQDLFDNATPSENSLAADGLLRLAALTGDETLAASPRRLLGQLSEIAGRHSSSFAFLLSAYERAITPPIEIALIGHDPALRHEVFARLIPASVAVQVSPGTGADATPLVADRVLVDGRPTAYVCERFACRLPVTTPEALKAEIDAALSAR
ncbi:MAG: thioredoxin domain-containing protein [Acidimicrobiia bacterium]